MPVMADDPLARCAVVTGAGSGIGRAIALVLSAGGTPVAALDIDAGAARRTADAIRGAGGRAVGLQADVRDTDAIEAVLDRIELELGPLGTLSACAGVVRTLPLAATTPADWDAIQDVNARGTFFWVQAVGRRLHGPGGAIVAVSSISGRGGRPLQTAYAASKAAVISIVRSAALAFAPSVRVNAVCPGIIDTPMWASIDRDRAALEGLSPGDAMRAFVERVPLARAGTPDDVAGVVRFLLSRDGGYVTGQAVNVCGGLEMD